MEQWNAVLQIRSPQLTECLRIQDLPLIDAVQLSILADPGAPQGVARALYAALRQRFRTLVSRPGRSNFHPCGGPQGQACMAYQEPNCRCYLIVITGSRALSSDTETEMLSWPRRGPAEDVVLPVLPVGSDPAVILGSSLDKTNVIFQHGHIDDTADSVLERVGISGAQRRLFISYRRTDTRELADQLFDAFSRAGFQVFLDRFSGTPGRLFPDELCEEIVDKGVVLLLEGQGLRNSPWTLAEVSFAYLLQIGLLAINVDGAPPMGLIASRDRHPVRRQSSGTLSPNDLEDVIRFVRREYARQMLSCRLFLEALLRLGLARHHLTPMPTGDRLFEVVGKSTKYLIALAERAPSISDVRKVSSSAGHGACRVVLGPHQFLAPERRRDLRWLLSTANTQVMGEGEVTAKTAAIAKGARTL